MFFFLPFQFATMSSSASSDCVRELDGDLFAAPKDHSLAHCVASDLKMGAGIAVRFKQLFKGVDELRAQSVGVGGVAVLKDGGRFVYYLITKEGSYDKPTYGDLTRSLEAMRKHMVSCVFWGLFWWGGVIFFNGLGFGFSWSMVLKSWRFLGLAVASMGWSGPR